MGVSTLPGAPFSRQASLSLAGAATTIYEGQARRRIRLVGVDASIVLGATAQTLTLEWSNTAWLERINRWGCAASTVTNIIDNRINVAAPSYPKRIDSGTSSASGVSSLTDASKAWAVNVWRGHVVTCDDGDQVAVVISNTATVLTITTNGWSGGGSPTAVGAYTLTPAYRNDNPGGVATASAATSLTDAAAAFTPNQLAGRMVFAVNQADGTLSRGFIIHNTATVLTVAAWEGGTPAATASYFVGDPTWSIRGTVTNTTNAPTTAEITLSLLGSGVGTGYGNTAAS